MFGITTNNLKRLIYKTYFFVDKCMNRPEELFIKKPAYVMKELEYDDQGNFFESVATCYPKRIGNTLGIDAELIHGLADVKQRWAFLFKHPDLWTNVDLFWAEYCYGVGITVWVNPSVPIHEMSFLYNF